MERVNLPLYCGKGEEMPSLEAIQTQYQNLSVYSLFCKDCVELQDIWHEQASEQAVMFYLGKAS